MTESFAGRLKLVTINAGSFRGFFGSSKKTEPVYVVADAAAQKVVVFDDAQKDTKTTIDCNATPTSVEHDTTNDHGMLLKAGDERVALAAASGSEQSRWMEAFQRAGATIRRATTIDPTLAKSFFELESYDMAGNCVPMETYHGRLNYTQLVELDNKYRDQGLQILAYPCNQFGGQEPGSHAEIQAFAAGFNATFPLFEKADVNGENTQPVFAYLKSKLTGTLGSSIKWNFTKFLVDRHGQPFKRYSPQTAPMDFEADILELLSRHAESFFELSSKRTDGVEISMAAYTGRVCLVVNVASKM
ncbi:phospholipid hydroperoxide glutathione peroxidase [Achlya hypogyna]|uniref:Glutathione peroxidase n=1 Tax=Achlya hypogyna TaxID=1202772 RepID=A0A1V9ZF53_ACHHY|nr:phospholipid hydroperoxide glutathione peroxidase [Achlya hypogyna]